MAIAITGSSGKLGGRVAALLAEKGAEQILLGRDPDRLPQLARSTRRGPASYGDLDAMRTSLHGAHTLLLVSGNLSGRRLSEHATAIDAALAAGVRRIVYISLMGAAHDATYVNARDHAQTEQYLASAGVNWTVLRPSFYSSMLPGLADDEGVIRGPAGDGTVSAVAHEDIARVAAAVLLDRTGQHDSNVYTVTGPESASLADAARELTAVLGRTYSYEEQSVEQAYTSREGLDDTRAQIEGWVSWYLAIGQGDVAATTDTVARLTGREPLTIAENLRLPPWSGW